MLVIAIISAMCFHVVQSTSICNNFQGIEKHPGIKKAGIKIKYTTAGVRGVGIRNKSVLIFSGFLSLQYQWP